MRSDRRGLASLMKRRGVTPLVTLVNLSGYTSEKFFSVTSLSSWECSSATPLTWEPP